MTKGFALALFSLSLAPAVAQDVSAFEKQELPGLVDTYKQIHAHPELSHFEANTSALVASELRKAGYTVTDHVGVYPDGSRAYGVVGMLKNGAGPTLLVRGDMDALPIIEETGVPYASHVTTKNKSGQEVGVMDACGHDVHTTVLIGTARALASAKSQWHGTLMIIGQPSEESIDGAKAMLADHLYERFGRPDMIIGLHDTNGAPAGKVVLTSGPALASSTSVDVTLHGIGGHGASPEAGKDPIVMAAMLIVQMQTIVSREESPLAPAVVTVGDIQGGTRRNIIPNEVKLELTTRAFSDKSRQVILDGIRQMAFGVATSAGMPAGQDAHGHRSRRRVDRRRSTTTRSSPPGSKPSSSRPSAPTTSSTGSPSWAAKTSASSGFRAIRSRRRTTFSAPCIRTVSLRPKPPAKTCPAPTPASSSPTLSPPSKPA